MLQIRLNKGSSVDGGIGAKSLPEETVTVACPDHLVLADLPVANGLGSATSASTVKIVGRRSRRQLAERVHFCVRCDFPIAVYGRLSPCEHAFCLDCARSDSICYLCDERIQKIQTIKMMEGIFICAAPHCLKSFLKKSDFESHIYNSHSDLLQPNMKKEFYNEPEVSGSKQASTMDLRGPPRPGWPSNSDPPSNDRDDKNRRPQPREQTPLRPLMHPKPPPQWQPNPSEPQPDHWPMGMQQQQNPDPQMYPQQQPNFPMHGNPNPMMMGPPPFGFPPFPSDGPPPFYGGPAPYELARSDSTPEVGSDQGSVMGFTPGPGGPANFQEGYSRPWNAGPTNVPFEPSQNGQGLLGAPQGMPSGPPPPPPGPPPPHLMQHQNSYMSADMNNDGRNYGWQSERRGSFGSNQD
ncbi:hypothetical protein KSS87_002288 [Heliosperma pusillum]|nr:hypothetical protein KSS87_002288 [Heliosperma pusillum]